MCVRVCECVFVCVWFRLFACVFQIRVRPIALSFMVEFENKMAQIIIMTRKCIANKNRVAKSKVKVIFRTKLCAKASVEPVRVQSTTFIDLNK